MGTMDEQPKVTSAQLWKLVVDQWAEDQVEAASKVSVEQAEKELTEAGLDVADEQAKAEAFLAELESKPPKAPPAPAAKKRK